MLYLLDANVLITANRTYYPLERVSEYWDWLLDCGTQGQVKIPREMYEEIDKGNDDLRSWLRDNKDALLFAEEVDGNMVKTVTARYAPDLNDEEMVRVGQDPFLIAHAYRDRARRIVVTTEVSKPTLNRANRRIPDVCDDLQVTHCNPFELNRKFNFTTSR